MTIRLSYSIQPADHVTHGKVLDPTAYKRFRSQQLVARTHWFVAGAAGLAASVRANMELVAIGFLCVCLFQVVQACLLRRQFAHLLRAAASGFPQKHVELQVDEEGLREVVEGIQSFAPWSSIVSHVNVDQTTFIKLKAGLWSIVPDAAFATAPEGSLSELIELLERKGVPKAVFRD